MGSRAQLAATMWAVGYQELELVFAVKSAAEAPPRSSASEELAQQPTVVVAASRRGGAYRLASADASRAREPETQLPTRQGNPSNALSGTRAFSELAGDAPGISGGGQHSGEPWIARLPDACP